MNDFESQIIEEHRLIVEKRLIVQQLRRESELRRIKVSHNYGLVTLNIADFPICFDFCTISD